ncbi:MAG: NYN domain-containing protein [Alphaproteobacteria bacterium]|nr:NYN domain-containing protein [Alphaproteobacteria bacterium]
MSRDSSGSFLSAVFVDYDNIYLSLKRKSEDAAKRFAKESHRWIRAIENGQLITPTNGRAAPQQRRMVMNRCYGNPVPRRNQSDNSTDMNSFPFVRHHFLRGGFEIVDCPPLTAQLKNSADIRMVMDIRDFLTHDTYFDEFVILSSDADFTPLLHRLRAHARRTVVFSNDHTALPYAALCDGEVREGSLIDLLLEDVQIDAGEIPVPVEAMAAPSIAADATSIRSEIVSEVVRSVLNASAPQPLEALAERAIRVLGHGKTVGSEWGGAGNFRDLLMQDLPSTVALTEQAPYFAYDVSRAIARNEPQRISAPQPQQSAQPTKAAKAEAPRIAEPATEALSPTRAASLQESIAKIHQACKAPPLSPPEYRAMFTLLANELATNQMQGHQTIENVRALATELGIEIKREDVRFIIDIIGKQDPWFEQSVSALVFASRFRNYVISACQDSGMQLSADEVDLIDAWFAGGAGEAEDAATRTATGVSRVEARGGDTGQNPLGERTARWWQETAGQRDSDLAVAGDNDGAEEFPRIIRNRLKA